MNLSRLVSSGFSGIYGGYSRDMNNASCADCGRIVAFRTQDPTEIAECRSCGTWVKRTTEKPGVAVRITKGQQQGYQQQSYREDEKPEEPTPVAAPPEPEEPVASQQSGHIPSPFIEQPDEDPPPEPELGAQTSKRARRRGRGDDASATSAIHATLRELQEALGTLQEGQRVLLERTLPVPDMPVPDLMEARAAATPLAVEQVAIQRKRAKLVEAKSFYTTRFSALQVPVIPITLDDLEVARELTDGCVLAEPVPEEARSDRESLLNDPLPEAPAEEVPENKFWNPENEPTAPAPAPEPQSELQQDPFTELTEPEPEPEPEPESEVSSDETVAAQSVQGQPENTVEDAPEAENPFSSPFFTDHATSKDEQAVASTAPVHPPTSENQNKAFAKAPRPFSPEQPSLSEQIASAKKNEDTRAILEQSPIAKTRRGEKSALVSLLMILMVVLLLLGTLGWFIFKAARDDDPDSAGALSALTQLFDRSPAEVAPVTPDSELAPLFELPLTGVAIPADDKRVEEAAAVAREFADTQSIDEAIPLIQPVERALLKNFYEPMVGPTIMFNQAQQIGEDRTEVIFLIKDYGRPERLMPVVKEGNEPFLVDWKSFAECEELTLLSLTQGTLIIDGEEIDGGEVRGWMKHGEKESEDFPISSYQGFRLKSITEEATAIAYARKGSPILIELVEALATTKIRYRGEPAIRAILRVERIVESGPDSNTPTRLKILEVLATDWNPPETPATAEEKETPEDENSSEDLLPPVDGAPAQ